MSSNKKYRILLAQWGSMNLIWSVHYKDFLRCWTPFSAWLILQLWDVGVNLHAYKFAFPIRTSVGSPYRHPSKTKSTKPRCHHLQKSGRWNQKEWKFTSLILSAVPMLCTGMALFFFSLEKYPICCIFYKPNPYVTSSFFDDIIRLFFLDNVILF